MMTDEIDSTKEDLSAGVKIEWFMGRMESIMGPLLSFFENPFYPKLPDNDYCPIGI